MRRSLVPSFLILVALAATAPSFAETTGAVFTANNQFVPGDDDYGKEAGAPGLLKATVTQVRGRQLQFVNSDLVPHSLTSWCNTAGSCGASVSGTRLFGTTTALASGGTADVARVSILPVGNYRFFCTRHSSFMFGTLSVVATP